MQTAVGRVRRYALMVTWRRRLLLACGVVAALLLAFVAGRASAPAPEACVAQLPAAATGTPLLPQPSVVILAEPELVPQDAPRRALKTGVGQLHVIARPWANVRIDAVDRGDTPMVPFELAAGDHTLELSNPDLRLRQVLSVHIAPNATTQVDYDFFQHERSLREAQGSFEFPSVGR